MLDEAIKLIEKERDMYIVQANNIDIMYYKNKLYDEIKLRDYILNILKEQKKTIK